MIKLRHIIWLFLLLPSLAFGGFGYQIAGQPLQGAAGESYIFEEPLEQPGTCETWDSEANQTYNYSANPISGTYSLHHSSVTPDHHNLASSYDELYVALEIERASDSANQDTFGFEDSGDAYTCKIVKRADGDIRLYNSGGTSITEQTPIAAGLGNTLWVKARCKKGTGANAEAELWYSTNGSSWTLSGSSSNGTWTNQINGIFVDGNVSETLLTDEIRIATSDITIVDTNNTSCP